MMKDTPSKLKTRPDWKEPLQFDIATKSWMINRTEHYYLGTESKRARKLEINEKISNRLLNASGGGENVDKSFCYLIEQVTENGG